MIKRSSEIRKQKHQAMRLEKRGTETYFQHHHLLVHLYLESKMIKDLRMLKPLDLSHKPMWLKVHWVSHHMANVVHCTWGDVVMYATSVAKRVTIIETAQSGLTGLNLLYLSH